MNWGQVTVAVIRGVSHAEAVKRADREHWMWNKGSTKIKKADNGGPMTFNTEPHVSLDFNFIG